MKNNTDQGDVDLSVLRKPIPTSVTGFMSVMKAFGEGTAEMRRVLERECDLIYECKVCRNIFRDVANLMTHKRLYCKAAFNSKRDFHFTDNGFIEKNISSVIEQEERATSLEAKRGEALPKDLGGVVNKMRMKQVLAGNLKPSDYYEMVSSKVTLEDLMQKKRHLLHLQAIPETGVAVYQTVDLDLMDGSCSSNGNAGEDRVKPVQESMKREVDEVNKLSTKTDIVIGPDGKALKVAEFRETVPKECFEIDHLDELLLLCSFDEDADVEPHECAICDARFDTEKTLILHIRLKHISSTKVYQCPSCSQTFLQAALVIKHLSNDHKKSLKKIRSMRETIHRRHMRMDEVQVKGPSRELNRLQTEKERVEAENNKAYLDNVANFDNSNQSMCTYCNKVFERKAVLTSHMVNCRIKFEKMLLGPQSEKGTLPAVTGTTTVTATPSTTTTTTTTTSIGGKRGPKTRENGTKEKELQQHDENSSSSTVVSSDGGGSHETTVAVAMEQAGENSNGSMSQAAVVVRTMTNPPVVVVEKTRKRKKQSAGGGGVTTTVKKSKKSEAVTTAIEDKQNDHSKVRELLEKEIWNTMTHEDRDDSYFSFDDKAPEDARDETYKRRFPCDTCNKSFSTMSNLKRHNVMFHYFQSRYRCRLCSYRAMKKNEAISHLRDEHHLDKEEHEMKLFLEQEKNEVSSSEVLDLDLDEGSSNQFRASSLGRDNSGTNSPVSSSNGATVTTTTTTTTTTTPSSTATTSPSGNTSKDSSSSGIISSSSPPETPPVVVVPVRKRGRPKGSFKSKLAAKVPVPDRGLRGDSATPSTAEFSELLALIEDKKKPSSTTISPIPIPPLPPQLDNNSSSSSTSSRPIRNRTKPKDKDFVYDYASLKEDFLYEDDAMHTALAESILDAAAATSTPNSESSSSSNVTPLPLSSPPPLANEVPVRISKKRLSLAERSSGMNGNGDGTAGENSSSVVVVVPAKRGRPRIKNLDRPPVGPVERRSASKNETEVEQKKSNSFQFNWEKNVIIPTRIIEHRHSVSDRGRSGGVAAHLKKEETRRNSIEIMTKSAGGGNVKENNRPVMAGPLGMIGNIMEARAVAVQKEGGAVGGLKDCAKLLDELRLRRQFERESGEEEEDEETAAVVELEHHILLNGRSFEEIRALNSSAPATAAAALSEEAEE